MMKQNTTLIAPNELYSWIPGDITLDSIGQKDWQDINIRGYKHSKRDAPLPAMRDYMIVQYKHNYATMKRKDDYSSWQSDTVGPGFVSLLSCGETSRWAWDSDIDVVHLYLTHTAVSKIANQVFDYDIERLRIPDKLSTKDTMIPHFIYSLENELFNGGIGGEIYVESIKNQLILHLLRHYADLHFSKKHSPKGLNHSQKQRILDFLEANISQKITLEQLASELGLSVPHFMRKFKITFEDSPVNYVTQYRIELAKRLLTNHKDMPLKVIANDLGFCDQSHMTRIFQRYLGMTPNQLRQS